MRKQLICVFLLGWLSLAGMGELFAADLKIGVVDLQRVALPQLEDINDQLRADFIEPRQQRILKSQQDLQDKITKLQTEAITLGVSQKQALEAEVRRLNRDLPRMQQDLQEDATRQQQSLMEVFNQRAVAQIVEFAKKEKYDLILPQNLALYAVDSLDVTDKIIDIIAKSNKSKK